MISFPNIRWTVLIGLILIPINCYWIIQMEVVRYSGHPTTISLLFNSVFCLFLLCLLNQLVLKVLPGFSFTQSDLLSVYVMLCLSSTIAGHGFMQMLIPIITHPFWFATPENDWQALFWRYLQPWTVVDDMNVLKGYYEGESTFYTLEHVKEWMIPILSWSAFVFALVSVMVCINVILRRQWTETERLAYPAIQLPLEMVTQQKNFIRNKMMWIGFSIAGGLDIINGLGYFYPQIPIVPVKRHDLGHFFVEKPWSAIGWFPISFYPFAIGLSFFMPSDISFSCWFFYLFFKGQHILGSMLGLRSLPRFPYSDEQSWGGYMGVLVVALWMGRRYFWSVLKEIIYGEGSHERILGHHENSEEPMRYRVALLWSIGFLLFIICFCHQGGMGVWVAVGFFLIYFALSTSISRIRAELGSPVHDIHWIGADEVLTRVIGLKVLGPRNLTFFSFLRFFNRAQYSHTMPQQLEGFKLAERAHINNRRLLWMMVIANFIAPLATFWAYLHIMYQNGATQNWPGAEAFDRLAKWLAYSGPLDVKAIVFMGTGLVFAIFLFLMRLKFLWWPFHPAGYAVSGSWSMNNIWFCILISWAVKGLLLRQGGLKVYQKAIPFFLGLILGEFTVGSLWTIIGIVRNVSTYGFWF